MEEDKEKQMTHIYSILTRTAWWAPAGVLVLHKVVMLLGLRSKSDGLMHFAGGLAISYFFWSVVPFVEKWFGSVSWSWRMLLASLSGCTVALMWELAEFASDMLLGTTMQKSLEETMLDLAFGTVGVIVTISILFVVRLKTSAWKKNEPSAADP